MPQLYGYPLLGRYGLGNMLFPWARCYLWCKDRSVPMIAPRWTQIRVGPYLRREQDKRSYQRLFHHTGYVAGLKRLWLLNTAQRIPEAAREIAFNRDSSPQALVVFQDMEDLFRPILGRNGDVRDELLRMTRRHYVPNEAVSAPFIGIHVRLGDFKAPGATSGMHQDQVNVRLPLTWYAEVLCRIRQELGFEAQARVFSDGSAEELGDLLALPAIAVSRGGTAVSDMLTLSQANLIIASGSTFSMWGSYLGQVPTVWYPGQRRQLILGQGDTPSLEPEVASSGDFPTPFLTSVTERWTAALSSAS